MGISAIMILEAVMLSSALSMDAFISGFAYGSNKIKIPMVSVHVINIICSSILGISLLLGSLVKHYIPNWLTLTICFLILFFLGMVKLLDGLTKSLIQKYSKIKKEIKFSMFNFNFILNLYANPEKADVDASKTISPIEAASLAFALSLDGLAIGFGAALGSINCYAVIICSLITDFLAIVLGCFIGNRVAHKLSFNISWLSGILLIVLAILKLL